MIYFIQQGNDGPIKIGYTGKEDIKQRLAALQTACPQELHVLACIAGDVTLEHALHSLFERHMLRGEWFNPDTEILSFLKYLKKQDNLLDERHYTEVVFALVQENRKLRGKVGADLKKAAGVFLKDNRSLKEENRKLKEENARLRESLKSEKKKSSEMPKNPRDRFIFSLCKICSADMYPTPGIIKRAFQSS